METFLNSDKSKTSHKFITTITVIIPTETTNSIFPSILNRNCYSTEWLKINSKTNVCLGGNLLWPWLQTSMTSLWACMTSVTLCDQCDSRAWIVIAFRPKILKSFETNGDRIDWESIEIEFPGPIRSTLGLIGGFHWIQRIQIGWQLLQSLVPGIIEEPRLRRWDSVNSARWKQVDFSLSSQGPNSTSSSNWLCSSRAIMNLPCVRWVYSKPSSVVTWPAPKAEQLLAQSAVDEQIQWWSWHKQFLQFDWIVDPFSITLPWIWHPQSFLLTQIPSSLR